MRTLTILLFSLIVFTAQAAPDMEDSMKQMGLSFKQAREAQTLEVMQRAMQDFSASLHQAQQLGFKGSKAQLMQQGLTELEQATQHTQKLLEQHDLAGAKSSLAELDRLRKKYHKERQPGFWQLLFGSDQS